MARECKAKVLTLAEFRIAERAAMLTRHSLRNRALLYLTVGVGFRACELRRLRIKDVVSSTGEIVEEVHLLKSMTKTKKQRTVPLSNKKLRSVLKEYLNHLKAKNQGQLKFDDYLFSSQKGGIFYKTELVRAINNIYRRAGLVDARSHSGRRTFITQKINEGVNLTTIAIIVGHSNINTTVGYYEQNPNMLRNVASKSIF